MTEAILIYITAASPNEADRISEALLERRLVACVNRLEGVKSRYWWQAALESAEECLILAKSLQRHWPDILATVGELHSYTVFDAVAIPILDGNPEYLRWIAESTAGEI